MRWLVVTEKFDPPLPQRDGGSRLVHTLCRTLDVEVRVLQFGAEPRSAADWCVAYPPCDGSRFEQRLRRAAFVAEHVAERAAGFDSVLFVHASMQFGVDARHLAGARAVTFPMLTTAHYRAAGEVVPEAYARAELGVLDRTDQVITPSHLERDHLCRLCPGLSEKIRVVPRGVIFDDGARRVHRENAGHTLVHLGSVKAQKNTLGLIERLAEIRRRRSDVRLVLAGPVQDFAYGQAVDRRIRELGLVDAIDRLAAVDPSYVGDVFARGDVFVTAAHCETFGRTQFEALAAGLPIVAHRTNNAAVDFLDACPAARFFDAPSEFVDAVVEMLDSGWQLRDGAVEAGRRFHERHVAPLLAAEVRAAPAACVADYDGTLFHARDPSRSARSIAAFSRYPMRIVCTARDPDEVRQRLELAGASCDVVIGHSGATMVARDGTEIRGRGLSAAERDHLHSVLAQPEDVSWRGRVVQVRGRMRQAKVEPHLRCESYVDGVFAGSASVGKLEATQFALRHLDWNGRVRAFGDGPNDRELLAFYDGTWIGESTKGTRTAMEVMDAD